MSPVPIRRGHALGLGLALLILAPAAWSEAFTFSADRVESVLATGREKTVLSGRAKVKGDKLAITADRIELSGKDFMILECQGSVVATDEEQGIRITTPYLRYDRRTRSSHMEGPTVLEDRENKVVLKAQWIENDGRTEVTLAQVNVRILKDNLACRSEYAIFRRRDKTLELTGAPWVSKKGDEYRASRIVINTESEEVRLEGEVLGTLTSPPAEGGTGAGTGAGSGSDTGAPTPGPGTPGSGGPGGTDKVAP